MSMNTQLWTDWDACEAIIDMPHDQFQGFISFHQDKIDVYRQQGEAVQPLRVKALPLPCPPGEGVWRVSAYGATAGYLLGAMAIQRWSAISRLDLRVQFPDLSDEQVERVVQSALARDRKNSVFTFNARPRKHKTDGYSGGYGLAVGSSQSDTRLTFYQKPDEPAQIEIQLSGEPLDNLLKAAWEASGRFHVGAPDHNRSTRFLFHLRSRMYDQLTRKLRSVPTIAAALEDAAGWRLRESWCPVGQHNVWEREPGSTRRPDHLDETTHKWID